MSSVVETTILAIVQGITEFVPVSSSGHLVLIREGFGFSVENGVFVDVALHAASLMAIFIYFFRDWLNMLKSLWHWNDPAYAESKRELLLLLLATLPVVVIGLFLEKYIEHFRNGTLIGGIMIVTSVWFFFCERLHRSWHEKIDAKTAIAMGIAQVFALLPGASRSGLTISAGILVGQTRPTAARFSFFMVAPTIVGATLLEGFKLSPAEVQQVLFPVSCGFVVCFVVSLACIHFCLQLFRRISMNVFGMYLLVLGVALLITHLV